MAATHTSEIGGGPGTRIGLAAKVIAHLGPGWALFRAKYAWERRSGALRRRTPPVPWGAIPAHPTSKLGFTVPVRPAGERPNILAAANAICAGRFRLFFAHEVPLGPTPDWHRNHVTGEMVPADRHWSTLGDFAFGDIKGVWEPSRFAWAFALARAYGYSRDDRYAERFWALFEHWVEHNPPNLGPNWMCGQEASFRLFAAAFAADILSAAPATTEARRAVFARFVLATGRRVAANLDYALSQKNNHGISECVGLITAAVLLPEAAESEGWWRIAQPQLDQELSELVYADGGFAQHSAVYHRLVLHDLFWLIGLLQRQERPVSQAVTVAAQRAHEFLKALVDPVSGLVPLYGANDGSNILPLSSSEYLDFRPTIQAGEVLLRNRRVYGPGPWDELAEWLAPGPSRVAEMSPSATTSPTTHFPDAGCALLETESGRLFLRCPTRFRHRPSQADLLHVDVSLNGVAVTLDAGTYSYHDRGRFAGSLAEASVHNTVTLDGGEPMSKVSRFLYLPWPHGEASFAGRGISAAHTGWSRRGLRHVRKIAATDVGFAVRDELAGAGSHRARVHWLLADVPFEFDQPGASVALLTPAGRVTLAWSTSARLLSATLVRADPLSQRGWWSPRYFEAAPALSLAIEVEFEGAATVETTIGRS